MNIKRLSLKLIIFSLALSGIVKAQTVNIRIPDSSGVINTRVNIPIEVLTDVTGFDIYSFQFSVCFDSDVLQFVAFDSAGTMSEGWESLFNATADGTIRFLAYTSDQPLVGTGILRFVTFDLIGNSGGQSLITFCQPDNFIFNDGSQPVDFVGGIFTLRTTYSITIDTNPTGLLIEVNDTPYTTPQKFDWLPESSHTLNAPSPQLDDPGIKYIWNNWNDGGDQSHTVVTESDFIYIAYYSTQYELTVSVDPDTGGTVIAEPSGPWYNPGSSVQLTANANPNWIFTNWSDDLTGSTNPETIIMNGPKDVTAHIAMIINITVTTEPPGLQIQVDNSGWQEAPWMGQWAAGSTHIIETNPLQPGSVGTRYLWKNWSDGGDLSHSVTVPECFQVYKAEFITQYLLITVINPEGTGTIEATPPGPWYNSETPVSITAMPNQGYLFSEWSGDLAGTTYPEILVIDTSKTVTAHFQLMCISYDFPIEGWYMISLPVIPEDNSVGTLFPTALGSVAYKWNEDQSGYVAVTALEIKKGYWIAMPGSTTVEICGTLVYSYTDSYPQGWHMIASVFGGADFTSPNDYPDGSVNTPAFSWNVPYGPYSNATWLNENEGYWVAIYAPCELTVGDDEKASLGKPVNSTTVGWEAFTKSYGDQPPSPPNVTDMRMGDWSFPKEFEVSQNYPNPFNPETVIEFALPQPRHTLIHIYTLRGEKIRALVDELKSAGRHHILWNGRADDGRSVPSGMYLIHFKAGEYQKSLKAVLMK